MKLVIHTQMLKKKPFYKLVLVTLANWYIFIIYLFLFVLLFCFIFCTVETPMGCRVVLAIKHMYKATLSLKNLKYLCMQFV